MIRRNVLLALVLNLALAATPAWAAQPDKIPVVGFLAAAAAPDDPLVEALRQGLRELGYTEGRNFRLEFRTAQGHLDRLRGLAEELVQLKADVIVAPNPNAAQELQRATSTIPIVVTFFDPVASGLVTSLAHPGGNVTGFSSMTTELNAKRLQLLKETIPRLTRVAVLWNPVAQAAPDRTKFVEDLKAAARSMSMDLTFVVVQLPEEFDAAFSAIRRARVQAIYLQENGVFYVHRMTLTKLALKARLPAIFQSRTYTDKGGLMSYGVNYTDQIRRSAAYIDKILKGAKPGDLPIEQPTKIEFVINLKTAKALGITIPPLILLRADEVIK